MSDLSKLQYRYHTGEQLDRNTLSELIVMNRVTRPDEWTMDEFAGKALDLEAKVSQLQSQLTKLRDHCRIPANEKSMGEYSQCCHTSGMCEWTEELWELLRETSQ